MKDLKKIKIMLFLTALSASVLVISNIVAVKLWNFCGIAVDGGIAIFPLSYIIGDVVMELYGKKIGDHVVFIGFAINIMAVLVFLLVGALPEYPGWGGQESYNAILGFTPRIVIGSLAGYVTSGLVNNFVFSKIKKRTGEKYLFLRSLGSSMVAKVFDILLFDTIAFLGVLSFSEFCSQVAFAYGAGIVLEILLTPLTYLVVKVLRKYEIRD